MKTLRYWIISILLILSGYVIEAKAGIIYNWQNITPNSVTGPIIASIEINEDYWQPGGSLNWSIGTGPFTPTPVSSVLPIQNLTFNTTGSAIDPIDFMASGSVICGNFYLESECLSHGVDPGGYVFTPELVADMNLTFNDGYLSGDMIFNDTHSDFRMNGDFEWEITRLGSDLGGVGGVGNVGCLFPGNCDGGTGAWIIDPSSIPAPEPASIAMLGLGLVLLSFVRSRGIRRPSS